MKNGMIVFQFATAVAAVVVSGIVTTTTAAIIPVRDTRIVQVTVFSDRAEIVREANVELPTGDSVVEFAGIPAGAESDSIRVTAEGVPATLGAVEIRVRAEEPVVSEAFAAAQDEVRRIENVLAELQAANQVDDELRAFLTSIRATAAKRESERLAEGSADPDAVSGMYTLLETKLGELARDALDRAARRKDGEKQLRVARAKLATERPGPGIRSRVASVEIHATRAGSITLRLAYVAPGASWRPSYRATLDAETGEVQLVSEGVVRQSTGEDWAGVALRLSTASPQRGVQPPMLHAWILRPAEVVTEADFREKQVADLPVPERFYQNVITMAPGVADASPGQPAVATQAGIARSAYNVAFEVPGSSDVLADGQDHRVVLRTESLPGRLVYRVVPNLAARAYLTSITSAPADYPLLAGPVRVFAGGAYLGSFVQPETGPGAELTLPFGVDNRVEIVHVPLPRTASREGISGKTREIDFAFKTRIQNLRDRPVSLILEDRVPVSEDERIEVRLGKGTTAGYEQSRRRPGVLLWNLELEAGEEREVVLEYSVRHPRDLAVTGL